MRELGMRTQALGELSHSLGLADLVVKKNELKKTRVYWRNQSPLGRSEFAEETFELVIPPADNAVPLLRFITQIGETLNGSCANIKHMVTLWDGSIVITFSGQPLKLSSLLDELSNLPEVEKVAEEPLTGGAISSIPKRFEFLTRQGTSPGRRVCITLKETDMAREEPVPVLA